MNFKHGGFWSMDDICICYVATSFSWSSHMCELLVAGNTYLSHGPLCHLFKIMKVQPTFYNIHKDDKIVMTSMWMINIHPIKLETHGD